MASSSGIDRLNITTKWADAQQYSPAPRHRRRLMLDWLEPLQFEDCLEVGCAQAYLLEEVARKRRIKPFGCDLSSEAIRLNRERFPEAEFEAFDLSRDVWAEGRQFDLVICSEVLEHIDNWPAALSNLSKMCRRYLLITVPSGKVHRIDRHIGHSRHFKGEELVAVIKQSGLLPRRVRHWGFPVHTLYKYAINGVAAEKVYESFGEQSYGPGKRFLSWFLYGLFFINDWFNSGAQLLILAERPAPTDGTSSALHLALKGEE